MIEGGKTSFCILIIEVSAVRAYDEDISMFKTIANYIVTASKKVKMLEQKIQRQKILIELLELENKFFKKLRNELYTLLFTLQTLENILSKDDWQLPSQMKRMNFVKKCIEALKMILCAQNYVILDLIK